VRELEEKEPERYLNENFTDNRLFRISFQSCIKRGSLKESGRFFHRKLKT